MEISFNYYMPTRIIFGAGKLDEIGKIPFLPGKKALIVIGKSGAMRRHGYLDRVIKLLNRNRVSAEIFDKIQPNPISDHVDEGASVAREAGCDFVLGLGGGSSIDSSKSIAVMAKNPGRYWDYIEGGSGGRMKPFNGALPIVAVPTTAGTGTEADPWAVITKADTNEKIGWGNDSTFPVLSIVDPELMLSVPPKTTAHTGMDAFFHAAESFLATVHQPASDLLALEAIRLITTYLPVAVKNGNNIEARTMLAWASTEAGICESLSSCISHHSLEHALSANYPDLPHGAGLCALSVSYFSYLAERNPERFDAMAEAMGEDVSGLTQAKKASAFISGLRKLIEKIGLGDDTLSRLGIKKEQFKKLAENAFYTMGGLFDVTPVKLGIEDVIAIFEKAY